MRIRHQGVDAHAKAVGAHGLTMEYTLTLRFKNAAEMQETVALLSQRNVRGGAENQAANDGSAEAGYTPSCERTRLALDAISKCQRVKLSRPAILESWHVAFPHVDLAGEIAKAEAWAQSKDVKRSAKGWAKALNSWLGKAQDKARGGFPSPALPTGHPAIARALEKVDPAVDAWAKAAQE
jgi:hypothetical protein